MPARAVAVELPPHLAESTERAGDGVVETILVPRRIVRRGDVEAFHIKRAWERPTQQVGGRSDIRAAHPGPPGIDKVVVGVA